MILKSEKPSANYLAPLENPTGGPSREREGEGSKWQVGRPNGREPAHPGEGTARPVQGAEGTAC